MDEKEHWKRLKEAVNKRPNCRGWLICQDGVPISFEVETIIKVDKKIESVDLTREK